MTAAIDLSLLPPPIIIEQLDYPTILAALQADLLSRGAAVGLDLGAVLALESEPLTLLLETAAYRELTIRNAFNQRAKGGMLAYAQGGDLDNLAANLLVIREPGELDAALLARTLLAEDGFSTAGPDAAYRFHALSADPTVADVAISSPAPCQVQVIVLSTAPGGAASPALIATVQAALSADTVRPMTDQVSVVSATTDVYNVTAQLVIGSGPDQATVIAAAQAALQAYAAGQYRIGLGVSLNAIIAALMQPGVSDLTLTSPTAAIAATAGVAPVLGAVNLTAAP